jgi:7-cyano-7-deazaguanine synthase in queuosine biosynthesis
MNNQIGMTSQNGPAAVVLLSGGLDSMVSAAIARERGFRVLALTIDYNQRHRVEIEAASRIAATLGAERHIILPLDLASFGGSALTAPIDHQMYVRDVVFTTGVAEHGDVYVVASGEADLACRITHIPRSVFG